MQLRYFNGTGPSWRLASIFLHCIVNNTMGHSRSVDLSPKRKHVELETETQSVARYVTRSSKTHYDTIHSDMPSRSRNRPRSRAKSRSPPPATRSCRGKSKPWRRKTCGRSQKSPHCRASEPCSRRNRNSWKIHSSPHWIEQQRSRVAEVVVVNGCKTMPSQTQQDRVARDRQWPRSPCTMLQGSRTTCSEATQCGCLSCVRTSISHTVTFASRSWHREPSAAVPGMARRTRMMRRRRHDIVLTGWIFSISFPARVYFGKDAGTRFDRDRHLSHCVNREPLRFRPVAAEVPARPAPCPAFLAELSQLAHSMICSS